MSLSDRVLCSTITLRHLPLSEALAQIVRLGFSGIDLGALPGVCDHVPYELTDTAVQEVAAVIGRSDVNVRSINGDIGDLNVPLDQGAQRSRDAHAELLLELCVRTGADALVLPNGRQSHDTIADLDQDLELVAEQLGRVAESAAARGVEVWVEAPHWFRVSYDLKRTAALVSKLPENIGLVCDVSHITASGARPRAYLDLFGARVRHVHIRDAEPGYIHHSVGRGQVDFPDLISALADIGYDGALALELETRDTADADRPAEALRAGEYLTDLLGRTARPAA